MQYQLVMGQLLNLQYFILVYLNIQIQKFICLSRGKTFFDVENRQTIRRMDHPPLTVLVYCPGNCQPQLSESMHKSGKKPR